MASPNATFTELVSTTFRNHSKEIKDNVSKNNALLRRLTNRGRIRKEDGGLSIVAPLDYASNGTYQRYSGFDVLNVAASDVISAAEYPWKQIAVNVVASGLELRNNAGEYKIINLVKARMNNAIRSFKNGLSADMYSDGTATNQINGLQALVADAGTGVVGGIDSSAFPFWRCTVQSAANPIQGGAAITPSPTTIESLMLNLWLPLVRGDDKPDLIVSSWDFYSFFEQSQTSIKRYTSDTEAGTTDGGSAGFVGIKYKTADVIYDGGSGIPNQHMYFLNTDYLELVVHKDADMTEVPELRSVNQDAVVMPVIWQGNLVASNRALQGVLKS
jgi:hypothetical protein